MSVGGRAGSPVHPLSAADLVCLSGEELDHRCSCSSSLSAADLMPLSGEELVHRCHHVSVQIQVRVVFVVLVQPLLSSAGYRYKYGGMYKCGALCWVSTDVLVASADACVSKGGCG